MRLEEFRIKHSTLIENYQFIEQHLKGIYAAISGNEFLSALEDVELSNVRKLVVEIQEIENHDNITVIPVEVYNRIEESRLRRNYWCHSCYFDMAFKPNGDPKNEKDINILKRDLREAEELREILFQIEQSFLYNYRANI